MVEKPPRNLFMCWTQEQSDWSKLFNTWIGLWNKEKEFCCRPLKGGKNSLPGIAFEICMSSVWVAMVADCPMAVATSLPKSLTQPTTHKKLLHTTKPLQRVNPRPRPYVWAWGCQIMQKKKKGVGGYRIRTAAAAARGECMQGTELPGVRNFKSETKPWISD